MPSFFPISSPLPFAFPFLILLRYLPPHLPRRRRPPRATSLQRLLGQWRTELPVATGARGSGSGTAAMAWQRVELYDWPTLRQDNITFARGSDLELGHCGRNGPPLDEVCGVGEKATASDLEIWPGATS